MPKASTVCHMEDHRYEQSQSEWMIRVLLSIENWRAICVWFIFPGFPSVATVPESKLFKGSVIYSSIPSAEIPC